MTTPLIKLENVDFFYDKGKPQEQRALKNINLEIYPGEYVSFLGPSGCGKSTLLYVIAGIERPDSGKVIINGRDLTQLSPTELAVYRQIGIGIIFQNFNLIPSISVAENIMMPMAFLGIAEEMRKKRSDEIIERLNLNEVKNRFPYELSGGQQQRVGIARALVNSPPLMLADEPLGNLDSDNANRVLSFLNELNSKDGKTVVMVTHEAWSLRDVGRIFHMKDGEIFKVEARKAGAMESAVPKASSPSHPGEKTSVATRAKTMSELIMRGYSGQEIERMQNFMTQLFEGKINLPTFISLLDKPFKEGGVGLWKQKAERVGKLAERAMQEEKELEAIYAELHRNPEAPLYSEVRSIRDWLLEDTTTKVDSLQLEQLEEIVTERIRDIITSENFLEVLTEPRKKGGLGFRSRTGLSISEKMESLLGESVIKTGESQEPQKEDVKMDTSEAK